MKDLFHKVLVTQHLSPVVATTTKTSTAIDLQGFNSASVVVSLGLAADTLSVSLYWTLKLQHSNDDVTYEDTVAADLNSTALTVVVDSSSKDRTAYSFGYQGGRRYLKAVATPTGSHSSGTPIAMLALRGTAAYAPVA